MRDVFSEIVDYAGLFPPATCTMAEAVRNFRDYRGSHDRWMLGRFVVAASRLEELAGALQSEGVTPGLADPWRLSVVLGANIPDAILQVDRFRSGWDSRGVLIDSVECKVATAGQVRTVSDQVPSHFRRYYEVPIEGPYRQLIAAIDEVGAYAKVRTGGTVPELFPAAEQLTQFLLAVTHRGVAFKATAGLHHPLRGSYPLTYDVGAARHPMYGFVNLLLATAELARGGEGETAQAILEDDDATHFPRSDSDLSWRDRHYPRDELASVRARFFLGFGSCSFREPVDELRLEVNA